jgi:RNA recognition motif-containing protein
MPRFTPSRKFKGFAFVEFAAREAAARALQALEKPDRDASLVGLRAMSKPKWTEMKEKLKAQLGGAPPETTASNEAPSKEAPSKASKQKALVASNGHVRFRDDDDDDQEEGPNDPKRPRTGE